MIALLAAAVPVANATLEHAILSRGPAFLFIVGWIGIVVALIVFPVEGGRWRR